jgi:hypothetical protein
MSIASSLQEIRFLTSMYTDRCGRRKPGMFHALTNHHVPSELGISSRACDIDTSLSADFGKPTGNAGGA